MPAPPGLLRALALTLTLAATGCAPGDPPPRRDLLLLSIDTLRADALGSYGSDRGASPFLDGWAERGVRFASAWSHSPKTAPSHMTLLTGLEPRVHGVGNLRTASNPSLAPGAPTLAQRLRDEGYATAAFTDGGNVQASLGFDRGFDVFVSRKQPFAVRAEQVRSWLTDREDDAPWFLFAHTYRVHDPYFPPPAVAQRFVDPDYAGRIIADRDALERAMRTEDLAERLEGHPRLLANYWNRADLSSAEDLEHLHNLYLACLADLDSKLAVLFRWLEAQGHLDDAVVVVTSDHGEEFGEHGAIRHGQLWREVLAVPLLVRLPGDEHAGLVIDAPVRHVDFLASALDLVGVGAPATPDVGPSWAGWLDDPSAAEARAVYAEHRSTNERPLDLWALREDGWLLHQDTRDRALFDLARDPLERNAVADAERRAALEAAQRRELGRLQTLAAEYSPGEWTELSADVTSELEALGYLGDGGN